MRKKITLLFLVQLTVFAAVAQVKYYAKENIRFTVSGTSTAHDWKMKSSTGDANAVFQFSSDGNINALTFLSFAMPAVSLKSDKSSMDKNAYKAMKTDKYAAIRYNLTSASVAPDGIIRCQGKLSLAGVTLDETIEGTAKVNADKTITVKGSKKISMKKYDIDAPSFMMGTLKTGNDVTISFELTFRT